MYTNIHTDISAQRKFSSFVGLKVSRIFRSLDTYVKSSSVSLETMY